MYCVPCLHSKITEVYNPFTTCSSKPSVLRNTQHILMRCIQDAPDKNSGAKKKKKKYRKNKPINSMHWTFSQTVETVWSTPVLTDGTAHALICWMFFRCSCQRTFHVFALCCATREYSSVNPTVFLLFFSVHRKNGFIKLNFFFCSKTLIYKILVS